MALFDTWLKLNRKQFAEQALEAPLRNELFSRILFAAVAILALQLGLLLWVGMNQWVHCIFPSVSLLVAFLTRKRAPPFALMALFIAFAATAILPIYSAARGLYEYPQFTGALILTILLSGLLMGKSHVRLWTTLCVMAQFAAPASNWGINILSSLVLVAAGWLVTLYSSHLQRLFEVSRAAEEQQRDAIVAERTRFARDIHDTLAQGFTGIMMQLNAAEQRLQGDSQTRAPISKKRGSLRPKVWRKPGDPSAALRIAFRAAHCWTRSNRSGASSPPIPASSSTPNSKASPMRCRSSVKRIFCASLRKR